MKKQFTVVLATENAAFETPDAPGEIARILREVADRVESGSAHGKVADINGNSVGRYDVQGGW